MGTRIHTGIPKPSADDMLALFRRECADFGDYPYGQLRSPKEKLSRCFKLRKWNPLRFCEKTGLTAPIFTKIMSKTGKYKDWKPSLSSLVAICVGLGLPFRCSEDLLASCGYALGASERDRLCRFILEHVESFDVDSAGEFLQNFGHSPLCGC